MLGLGLESKDIKSVDGDRIASARSPPPSIQATPGLTQPPVGCDNTVGDGGLLFGGSFRALERGLFGRKSELTDCLER